MKHVKDLLTKEILLRTMQDDRWSARGHTTGRKNVHILFTRDMEDDSIAIH